MLVTVGPWFYWEGPYDPFFWTYWPYYHFYYRAHYPRYYAHGAFFHAHMVAPRINSVPRPMRSALPGTERAAPTARHRRLQAEASPHEPTTRQPRERVVRASAAAISAATAVTSNAESALRSRSMMEVEAGFHAHCP